MNLPFKISEEKINEIKKLEIIPKGKSQFEIGDSYNHLIILGRAKNAVKYNNTYVYAICDCPEHNIIRVQLNKLKNNNTTSCGCEHKKAAQKQGKSTYINMLGAIIGDFKIIKKTEERDSESVVWLGQCIHCGEYRKITQRNMKNNITHPNICSCQKVKGSSYEIKVSQILKENNIFFKREQTFYSFIYKDTNRHPRFDFFLPDFKCLIEVHGKQHYIQGNGYMKNENLEKRQFRDALKVNWALQNNYYIIIIPYDQINNITILDLLPNTSKFLIKEEISCQDLIK